jgi:NADH:ubiquinone oxidoreductase subunit 2 (subunit N)
MELSPLRAAAFALSLMSLAGIPPLPGFWAKLAVLGVSYSTFGLEVTALAALGGVVGVVYYLKPLPDLFAKIRHGRAEPQPIIRLVLVVALVIFATFALRPALAWQITDLARSAVVVQR